MGSRSVGVSGIGTEGLEERERVGTAPRPRGVPSVHSPCQTGRRPGPAIVLILGLQLSSALVTTFQALIPRSPVLPVVTLKLIVDRTSPELLVSRGAETEGIHPLSSWYNFLIGACD